MAKKTEVRAATGHINPFGLRMQADLRERLEAAAAGTGRSLNSEIVARLEGSFDKPQVVLTDDQARDMAAEIMSMIDVKSREPAKLQADDLAELFRQMEQRRLEEAEVLSALAVTAEQEAHALHAAEGKSARYQAAQEKLRELRAFQNELHHRGVLLMEAGHMLDPRHTTEEREPDSRPAPKMRAKRHG